MSYAKEKVSRSIINTIIRGEVSKVQEYGAFVKIPSYANIQGLVHKSQISSAMVPDATEVLQPGDTVWCKVISISDDDKIALSMKVVNQGSGKDLDPNGVQIHLDKQKKEKGIRPERKKIELDAVLQTKCAKCGVQGHLSKDCFRSADGKVYELIPEPEEEKKIFGTEEDLLRRTKDFQNSSLGSSSSKEKKRRHDSSTSESSVTAKRKYKSKKKRKDKMHKKSKKTKKKKRHRSHSSSSE